MASAQALEDLDGLLDPIVGYEEMVMVVAGKDVAADTRLAKGAGDRRGETDGVQRRAYLQGDPASYELVAQSSLVGVVAAEYKAASLGLDDAGHDDLVCDVLVRVGHDEDVLARAAPR